MAGIRAQQAGAARRRLGQQIARDIARRQAHGPHGGDADMGQVLADAGPDLEHLVQGRGHIGDGGVVAKVLVDAVHQLHGACQQRPARRKAHRAISGDFALKASHGGIELVLHHLAFLVTLGIFQPRAYVFPGQAVARDPFGAGTHGDAAFRQYFQVGMRLLDGNPFARVVEIILAQDAAGGFQAQSHAAGMHRLRGRGAGPQMRQVPGMGYVLQVAIGGAVADEIFHSRLHKGAAAGAAAAGMLEIGVGNGI